MQGIQRPRLAELVPEQVPCGLAVSKALPTSAQHQRPTLVRSMQAQQCSSISLGLLAYFDLAKLVRILRKGYASTSYAALLGHTWDEIGDVRPVHDLLSGVLAIATARARAKNS